MVNKVHNINDQRMGVLSSWHEIHWVRELVNYIGLGQREDLELVGDDVLVGGVLNLEQFDVEGELAHLNFAIGNQLLLHDLLFVRSQALVDAHQVLATDLPAVLLEDVLGNVLLVVQPHVSLQFVDLETCPDVVKKKWVWLCQSRLPVEELIFG